MKNKCIILIPFSYEKSRECGFRTVLSNLKKVNIEILVGCWGENQNKAKTICSQYNVSIISLDVKDHIECFNRLVSYCDHDIVCFHCADCLVSVKDYEHALEIINKEDCLMYPFTSPFIKIPTHYKFNDEIDYINCKNKTFYNHIPLGGIFFIRCSTFIKIGMLNENIKICGPDDKSLYYQALKFGVQIKNGEGPLYHINHLPQMISLNQEIIKNNKFELEKIKSMNRHELEKYISTWTWRNNK